jgi:hypothetical protein
MTCDAALVHHDRRRLALRALRDHLTVIDHHSADREARSMSSDRPAAASSRAPVGPLSVRLHWAGTAPLIPDRRPAETHGSDTSSAG